jgi:hypothetical protein
MNYVKSCFAIPVATALLLTSCGKRYDRRVTDSGAKAAPPKAPPSVTQQVPSTTQISPVQSISPNSLSRAVHEARQRVMAEIVSVIGQPADDLTRDHWRLMRERYWLSRFNRVIHAPGGTTSIQEVLRSPKDTLPIIVQLLSGAFETQNVKEQDSLIALHNLAIVTAAAGGTSLPAALADRQSDPNITEGDTILFAVFADAFEDVPRAEQLGQGTLKEWQQMAVSPNAVVRLLALQTFRRVAPEPEQWLEFYRSYKNERDEGILTELTDRAVETAKPEAAAILDEIRSRSGQPLQDELAAKLNRSIDFLKNLAERPQ